MPYSPFFFGPVKHQSSPDRETWFRCNDVGEWHAQYGHKGPWVSVRREAVPADILAAADRSYGEHGESYWADKYYCG